MRNADIQEVAAMLSLAMGSGLGGMPLPRSELRFVPEQIAYINTVYDEARNRAKPSKARQKS